MTIGAAARKKSCLQFPLRFLLASLLVVLLHVVGALPQMLAQQAVVERVDFEGNRRIRSETLRCRAGGQLLWAPP